MTTKSPLSLLLATVVCCLAFVPMFLTASARAQDRKLRAGLLTAYTATSTYDSGKINYFPHTGYRIFYVDGRFYRNVRNHMGPTDELPFTIAIPAGDYFLLAKSETQGGVKVPFTINPGRWTVVRLDDPTRKGRIPPNVDVIRLPDSSIAGWLFEKRAPGGLLERHSNRFSGIFGGD